MCANGIHEIKESWCILKLVLFSHNVNQGPPGDRGDPGIPGEQGETGPKGSTGQDGLKGDKGEEGPVGAPGRPGADGVNGNDCTLEQIKDLKVFIQCIIHFFSF